MAKLIENKEEIEKVILVAVSLDDSNDADESLDELEEQFHLSKPYLSKYIKEKSGKTFGELVKNVRMKKARTLLKGGNMTVETIAEKVGYQNVEHFTRLFKKKYGMTPKRFISLSARAADFHEGVNNYHFYDS